MRIGIDARMLGPTVGGGGLGRYVEELVKNFGQYDNKHRFVLFLKTEDQEQTVKNPNFETRVTHTHWYTLKEQLLMPFLINREHLDIVHFPHWNVPMLLRAPFVVTIHDLILLEEPRSAKATTRSPVVYAIKYFVYKTVLARALKRSRAIIAVSQYTKDSILKHFPQVPENKITVIYEGLTNLPKPQTDSLNQKNNAHYILYVGNAYPHKNLNLLMSAFEKIRARNPNLSLVLAGKDDVFFTRLRTEANRLGIESNVRFFPNPTDEQLATLYTNADVYVFPSRNEGFGLPALEAMSFGIPVIASKAGSLPEILGPAALYFDPKDANELANTINRVLTDEKLRQELKNQGYEQIKRYSWKKMTEQIESVYQSCA